MKITVWNTELIKKNPPNQMLCRYKAYVVRDGNMDNEKARQGKRAKREFGGGWKS